MRELVHDHMASCARCRQAIAALTRDLPSATTTIGRYRIDGIVGEGGFGVVVAGHDLELDRPVAIKLSKAAAAKRTTPNGALASNEASPAELSIGELARALTRPAKGSEPKDVPERDRLANQRFQREARITARLQHPAIVPVYEVGRWDNGDPFYAMKRVDGRSLHDLIELTKRLEERLTLLPNVLAIADAIAYAHSRGVLHRDLKPHNILVGAFGETVVIDWGLARESSAAESDPRLAAGGVRDAGLTMAGEVMGTPAYMPPEQALGDALDERADVYALGATLYHVLAGRPPYSDAGRNVLASVVAGPPTPLQSVDPRIPPDLLAIVAKAMAWDRSGRYDSAKQVADDLRRFTTGQLVGVDRDTTRQPIRRWIRGHRAIVALAAGALIVLAVVVAFGLTRIVQEQHRIEKNREDAEHLMGFMLGDLRAKLEPIGKLALLEDVARKAQKYYDERPELSAADDQRRRAETERQLGDVLLIKGDLTAAQAAYQRALAIGQAMLAAEPSSIAWQRDLARTHIDLGETAQRKGDRTTALSEYRASEPIIRGLVAMNPDDRELEAELGSLCDRIGVILLDQGARAQALTALREAHAISERLAAAEPTSAVRQRGLARSYARLGSLSTSQGEITSGLASLQAAENIQRKLVEVDPNNMGVQRELAITLGQLARALQDGGDGNRALAVLQESRAIRERLVAYDPTNREWLRELSIGHSRVGDVLADVNGDTAGALAQYQATRKLDDQLVAMDPSNTEWQRDLAITWGRIGDVLHARGDVSGAMAAHRKAVAIQETLAAGDPGTAMWQQDLFIGRLKLGDVLLTRDQIAEALATFRAAQATNDKLLATDPDNREWQHGAGIIHERLGTLFNAQGDATTALAEHRTSLTIRKHLAELDPNSARAQRDLAFAHRNLGEALLKLGDRPAALREFRTGLGIMEALVAKDPASTEWKVPAKQFRALVKTCCGPGKNHRR
ncbi:MAG: protein kinase [Kofleriaceae bacterium]